MHNVSCTNNNRPKRSARAFATSHPQDGPSTGGPLHDITVLVPVCSLSLCWLASSPAVESKYWGQLAVIRADPARARCGLLRDARIPEYWEDGERLMIAS